jgi:hypothetical protein
MPPRIVERPARAPRSMWRPVARRLIDHGGSMTVYSSPADGTSARSSSDFSAVGQPEQRAGSSATSTAGSAESDVNLTEPAGDVNLPTFPTAPLRRRGTRCEAPATVGP